MSTPPVPPKPPNKLLEWALAIAIMAVLTGFLVMMVSIVRGR
jgi:hypothetical protein